MVMKNSQRNSILCPNCRKLISRDEPKCPHCGILAPGAALKQWSTLFFKSSENLIRFIIWSNVGMYLISLMYSGRSVGFNFNPFGLLSPDNDSLVLLGATGTIIINSNQQWWTLLSANYLHGSVLHILFNMMALMQLAPVTIQEYGAKRMFVIYTTGGVLGFFISYIAGVRLTIGASAAVCALIGALLYYGKSRSGSYGQEIYRQVFGWALGIFIFGYLVPGINNWGHGGGMLAGALLGFLLGYQDKKKENILHKMLASVCIFSTIAILFFSIIRAGLFLFASS
jgi:rhomboid protease GluP